MKKLKLKITNKITFDLIGHSKSSESTYFFLPEYRISLDIGNVHKDYDASQYYFITHTHADHSIYIPSVQKAFKNICPDVYVPFESVEYVDKFIFSLMELNNCCEWDYEKFIKMKRYFLIGVKDGESYNICKDKVKVKIFKSYHSIPCVSYGFYQIRNKLKKEYLGMKGYELKKLRENNVQITREELIPMMMFCGDTTDEFFENELFKKEMKEYKIPYIMIECTFFGDRTTEERAKEKKHIHFNQIEKYIKQYKDTTFLLIHFSLKYKDQEIKEYFKKKNYPNVIPCLDD